MAQLRQDYPEYVKRNTEIIAIGPEDPNTFTAWWNENRMPFTGIPDPEHVIAGLYGQEVKLLKLGRMPASVLIDKQGKIRFAHFGESMSDIPQSRQMLSLIDELNAEN
ncbi:MAG: redoxin domain-containing protein [Dehalococcoidaceae bacterium]|nr:redoxin domain-containing protein [Dehalococcoidaceae bacterium]